MELRSADFFYTLSLISVTFAVVSALVMLLRQTMGGRLSDFDVYLTGAYVRFGFGLSVAAILPTLVVLFGLPGRGLWGICGLLAAAIVGSSVGTVVAQRRQVSKQPISIGVLTSFLIHACVSLFLVVFAFLPPLQNEGAFAAALTISLADVMWTFVRRITSLLGSVSGSDWDPRRG